MLSVLGILNNCFLFLVGGWEDGYPDLCMSRSEVKPVIATLLRQTVVLWNAVWDIRAVLFETQPAEEDGQDDQVQLYASLAAIGSHSVGIEDKLEYVCFAVVTIL